MRTTRSRTGDIARIASRIRPIAEAMPGDGFEPPTQFDIVTALAFVYYAEQKCDAVALEVGLGGRLDSTNVISAPAAAVITNIGYDHMEILGDTLEKIAFEKAGVIKPGSDVVLYPQQPGVDEVFAQACRERGARAASREAGGYPPGSRRAFRARNSILRRVRTFALAWLGPHQLFNAAVAVKTAERAQHKGIPDFGGRAAQRACGCKMAGPHGVDPKRTRRS